MDSPDPRAYLRACAPAISGNRGHDQAFGVACGLIRNYGLSAEQAYPYFQEYNQLCDPPFNERELRHKLTDAERECCGRISFLADKPKQKLPKRWMPPYERPPAKAWR